MASLKDIKLRMVSISNTQQITRAMKLVSASKMRRAEDKITQARPYSEKLLAMVTNLKQGVGQSSHPLLEQRKSGKAIVLLITSDRGLCGGLNSNLGKKLDRFLVDQSSEHDSVEIIAFGRKGAEFFESRDKEIALSFRNLNEAELKESLIVKIKELVKQYSQEEFNHLYLAYNRFKNVISQLPMIRRILPVEYPAAESQNKADNIQFIFEPSSNEILNNILPKYVENQAYTALLDNFACEHAARMTAMNAATQNAKDMLAKLQLKYNRARQAAITSELIEIISGAEAL